MILPGLPTIHIIRGLATRKNGCDTQIGPVSPVELRGLAACAEETDKAPLPSNLLLLRPYFSLWFWG